jgi:hypothetical protein
MQKPVGRNGLSLAFGTSADGINEMSRANEAQYKV